MLYMRFLLAYGFCFGGVEFVRWGMKLNGAARAINPAWRIISQIHNIFITTALVGALGALMFVGIYFLSERKPYYPPERKTEPIDPAVLAERQRKAEEARLQREEQIKLEEGLRKQVEFARQKRLEEERIKMSADDVTRSALQDFL
jgi:hypothetical protein